MGFPMLHLSLSPASVSSTRSWLRVERAVYSHLVYSSLEVPVSSLCPVPTATMLDVEVDCAEENITLVSGVVAERL